MFVRKIKNRSGSTSIQIIDKSNKQYKIVETVGVSKKPKEIQELYNLAKYRLKYNYIKELNLFKEEKQEIGIIQNFISNLSNNDISIIGPELIIGKIFNEIGFNTIPEDLFRHLVISRLIKPGSKLNLIDYLYYYNRTKINVDSIYRFLDKFYNKYKKKVEDISFNYSKRILGEKISVVFYDVTTLYFESESEDDLRKIGFSKDGKFQCPQIQLGLLVGKNGYPLGYNIFEGNKFEGYTLIPVLQDFEKRYKITKPIIIADAGLLSKNNIKELTENNYKYILGARIKNESMDLKSKILTQGKLLKNGESVSIEKSVNLRLILSYSAKRAKKDEYNRKKGLKRLEKKIKAGTMTKESINNRGYNKFLKIHNKIKVSLDKSKIQEDIKWDGLKGYITNTKLAPSHVIDNYKYLWQIEKAFRVSKTDLRIRPIYHYKRKRIESHICISFAAYTVYKELERVLKENNINISIKKALESTKSIYQITYKDPVTKISKNILLKLDETQQKIYNIIYKK